MSDSNGGVVKERGGFTLVEVLISVVILAIGMVSILQGLQTAVTTLDAAVDKTRCAVLLRQQLNLLSDAADAGQDITELESHGRFREPYDLYHWEMQADKLRLSSAAAGGDSARNADESGNLYRVRLVVRRIGSAREYALATLIFVPPPEQVEGGLPQSANQNQPGGNTRQRTGGRSHE